MKSHLYFLFPLQKNTWFMRWNVPWWSLKTIWKSHIKEDAPDSLTIHVKEAVTQDLPVSADAMCNQRQALLPKVETAKT